MSIGRQIFSIIGTTAIAINQVTGSFNKTSSAVMTFIGVSCNVIAQRVMNRYYKLNELKMKRDDNLNNIKKLHQQFDDLERLNTLRKEDIDLERKHLNDDIVNYIKIHSNDYFYAISMIIATGSFITGTVINCQAGNTTEMQYSGYAANSAGILFALLVNLSNEKKINVLLAQEKNSTERMLKKLNDNSILLSRAENPSMPETLLKLNNGIELWNDLTKLTTLKSQFEHRIMLLKSEEKGNDDTVTQQDKAVNESLNADVILNNASQRLIMN